MDWVLRQMGYANVAIWLAGPDPEFQLGAYMKYTISGDPALTEAMRQGLLPILRRDGMIHLTAPEAAKVLTAEELAPSAQPGRHGNSLPPIWVNPWPELFCSVMATRHFTAEDAATLRAIAPVFAVTLATMVRTEANEDEEDQEDADESDGPLMDEPDDTSPRRRKKDDADWWKRGEQPPF